MKKSNANLPALATARPRARKPTGGALTTLAARLAADAATAAAVEPTAGGLIIRFDKKKFTVGENRLNDPLELIVLGQSQFNAMYDTPFDPEDPQPPACFAIARMPVNDADKVVMVKHIKSPRPSPAETCAVCDYNVFGSADTGRGKACNNYRRLAVVMADDPALRGDGELQVAVLQLPPTALRPWSKYVKGLAKVENLPPHGVVTRFSFDEERNSPCPIPKSFERIVRDNENISASESAVVEKVYAARDAILADNTLYAVPSGEARAPKKKVAAKGGKKLNRKLKGAAGRAATA